MKKNVAKILAICLILTTSLLAFAACGGGSSENSKYVGTWNAVKISYSGIEMEPDEAGLDFSVEISADGSLKATTNGEEDGEGEWEETDDGISIKDGTGAELTGQMDGDQLIIDFGDDFIVTMEKE